MTTPRPQYVKPGDDPTRYDLRDDGDRQPPGCWKILALLALPIGLCIGAGGVSALSAKPAATGTITATATVTAMNTAIPTVTPRATPIPLPITATPGPDPAPVSMPSAVPTTQTFCYRRVLVGETVGGIAAAYGVSIRTIQAYNAWLTNPSYIYKGAVLKIPCQRK
jgi:LysM repeat protein